MRTARNIFLALFLSLGLTFVSAALYTFYPLIAASLGVSIEFYCLERSANGWDRRGRGRSQCIILERVTDTRFCSISYHFRSTTKTNRKELSAILNGEILTMACSGRGDSILFMVFPAT